MGRSSYFAPFVSIHIKVPHRLENLSYQGEISSAEKQTPQAIIHSPRRPGRHDPVLFAR